MLADRSYMHADYPRRSTSALVWLVATIIAAFVLQLVLLSPMFGSAGFTVVRFLALTVDGLRNGHVWTLATHALLHNTHDPFHILFTILGLIFVGRELEPLLGSKKFLGLFLGAILCGGLSWTAVHWRHDDGLIGAGAGIFAFLVVLCGLQPEQRMTLFFFPVSFRLQYLLYWLLGVDVLALVFYEIGGAAVPLGLSPASHLGGMLAGWVYFRFVHANNGWDRAAGLRWPAWLRRKKGKSPAPAFPLNFGGSSTDFRAEVDRILDKINSQGFGALTNEEKRILDEAKDLLSRQ